MEGIYWVGLLVEMAIEMYTVVKIWNVTRLVSQRFNDVQAYVA
jgi:hypothetical protein